MKYKYRNRRRAKRRPEISCNKPKPYLLKKFFVEFNQRKETNGD